MKKLTNITTETYNIEDIKNIFIDIVIDFKNKTREAYIYDNTYGIKKLLFGICIDDKDYEDFTEMEKHNKEFLEVVECSIDEEEIESYYNLANGF